MTAGLKMEPPRIDRGQIRAKFGDDYQADADTYVMGIDQRLARAMAERFRGRAVLETCTGAGFTTIALARVASSVVTVELERRHRSQARANVSRAGLDDQVTFVAGDVLAVDTLERLPPFDSALLDPDWAVAGPGHVFRFKDSNTRPPADRLLLTVLERTRDVALVLAPSVDERELDDLPAHERQSLFLGGSHELYCLYFGSLARQHGPTTFRA
jgi:16S rRNA G966 N2-methylase RsmD